MTGVLHFAAAPRGWHEIVAAGLGLDLLLAPRELQFPGHEWEVLRSRLGRGNPATFTLPPNALDRSDERADAEVWHRESTHRLDFAVHAQRHVRPHQQRDSRERTGPATPRRRPLPVDPPRTAVELNEIHAEALMKRAADRAPERACPGLRRSAAITRRGIPELAPQWVAGVGCARHVDRRPSSVCVPELSQSLVRRDMAYPR
jgi:hypothetical protein